MKHIESTSKWHVEVINDDQIDIYCGGNYVTTTYVGVQSECVWYRK